MRVFEEDRGRVCVLPSGVSQPDECTLYRNRVIKSQLRKCVVKRIKVKVEEKSEIK